ncbi:MAG: hypothetical protein U1E29_10970 [Coriobacteriia bacterium]|nr:hypothetical protein [Coriobacteriia bacterium]
MPAPSDLSAYRRFAGAQALAYSAATASVALGASGLADIPAKYEWIGRFFWAVVLLLGLLAALYARTWRYSKESGLRTPAHVAAVDLSAAVESYYYYRQSAATLVILMASALAVTVLRAAYFPDWLAIVCLTAGFLGGIWAAGRADSLAADNRLVERRKLWFSLNFCLAVSLVALFTLVPAALAENIAVVIVAAGLALVTFIFSIVLLVASHWLWPHGPA